MLSRSAVVNQGVIGELVDHRRKLRLEFIRGNSIRGGTGLAPPWGPFHTYAGSVYSKIIM